LLEEAVDLSKNLVQKKRVTEKNVNRLFDYFVKRVLRGKNLNDKSANELVNVFITTILNKDQNYIHPHKPNTLITESFGNVIVNGNTFKSFFMHYQRDYSMKERDRLTAICDRLIEDTTRRFQGEFFTPTEWVDEAHRMIALEFGEDWKEKYVVWDPAWGTGNLTRDYKFKELYASTLNKSDLDIAEQMGYNPEAVKFQFDFLNDSDDKLSQGLKDALELGKKILVLMNPPYGVANDMLDKTSSGRGRGMGKTVINSKMLALTLGKAAQQLYIQFLFRCLEFGDNISICAYTVPTFLTTKTGKSFRKMFLNKFSYINGFLFNAGYFSNVSKNWGISLTLWSPGVTRNKEEISLIVKNLKDGRPEDISKKRIYNLDSRLSASDWAKKGLIRKNKTIIPHMTSALNVSNKNHMSVPENFIGHIINNGNNIYSGHLSSGIFSSIGCCGSGVIGFPVVPDNFLRIVSLFTARKIIKPTWANQKDEYFAPNIEHLDYKQWNNDCLVYSLFNNSSHQSSLRDITYKDKQWDIINEWFWMSNETMRSFAEDHVINEIELDCRNFSDERFIYKKLQETPLSEDAQEVLKMAESLVIGSLRYRNMMIEEHPEYHLNTWDAGWYQIKLILKRYMPEELKSFVKLYKEFEDRMREGVYKFEFLRR
jgi:hypothetical protein